MSTRIYVGNLPFRVTAEGCKRSLVPMGRSTPSIWWQSGRPDGGAASGLSRWRVGHAKRLLPCTSTTWMGGHTPWI